MRRGTAPRSRRTWAPLVVVACFGAACVGACASLVGLENEYQVAGPDAGPDVSVSASGAGGSGGGTGGAGTAGASTCVHDPCTVGLGLAKDCDPCVTQICEGQPFCCSMSWEPTCVDAAEGVCGLECCGDGWCAGGANSCATCAADCGDCSCPHSVCTAGAALTEAGCREACVTEVCADLPECCTYFTETKCIQKAEEICKPDPCVVAVCAQDAKCCNQAWGASCVTLAQTECMAACDCIHPLCQMGGALVSTCDPCVTELCKVDTYCCSGMWDGLCIQEVEAVCGIHC